MTIANRAGIPIVVALIGAVLGLILVVLGSSTHVAAQSGSDPEATLTVVITSGDDTVSWSDPDACTSHYNTYLSVASGPDSGTKTRTHIGSVASGSTEATQAISYNYTGDSLNPPHVEVELYCGTFDASSSQNVLIASQAVAMWPGYGGVSGYVLRNGTYSSWPLTALSISSGSLSPAFDRGHSRYTAEVPNDVEAITLDPTVLNGYQTDFVRNPTWGVVQACSYTCVFSYGDGTTTGIVLADADEETEGFQINLNRGENRLGIGVNEGNEGGPGRLYYLTVTVANSPATGQPTISGTAQVGQTLTADTSGISDADGLSNVSYSYQWLSSRDVAIDGATSSTYSVQSSDTGKVIKVRVTFTDDAGNDESLTSEATSAVTTANSPATGAPTISGTAQVGQTLTADTSGISDADGLSNVSYSYQWLSSRDVAIIGATSSTYSVQSSDTGKVIKVRVTFTDDAGNDESLTSEATSAVTTANNPATGAPTISGTAQVGQTLTADTSGISDADGLSNVSYSYQWLSSRDVAIIGATSSTYSVQSSDTGKVIKVRVTFTDDAGNDESLTSEATSAVTTANNPATGAPTISGTAQVGQTLTADTSGISDADGLSNVSYSYQWLSSRDVEIDGATSSTYTVQSSDTDKAIKVRVTFTDDAGNDESLTSEATSAVVMGGL